jgi:acetylornithine/N-succinyldiaminopimelate aminotransferase
MKLFNVYPRFDITLTKAKGVYVYDETNQEYLDLYGGHGVISIGHSHPHYKTSITAQLDNIGFYSNSVQMPIQEELVEKLAQQSGYINHQLFLCNSGAEANENAIKLASFHTGKKKVIAFKGSFHGRTAATLNVTDNHKLSAPVNTKNFPVEFVEMNNEQELVDAFQSKDVSAVIIEGIQGVGGLNAPTENFLKKVAKCCKTYNAILILDEIQSGYGRTGKFFAHQHANIKADIITMAKGMGNGFPIAGLLINLEIKASYGLLGTTFGGNQLACAAGIAVLDILKNERLLDNAQRINEYLVKELKDITAIKLIKGKGLMLGVEFDFPITEIRKQLLFKYQIFTGASTNLNLLRILPPLCITEEEIKPFINALKQISS